ncbi:neutral ceramidase isoform X2 [Ceratina calcarata]|uniref:Neutral ceramidase n=1 Tax=Ceratina calcarata TaxID=156304 RepID=A0AAJ7JGZ6_9HYME|nr:neutral ceramidase isoform X1 [Ceratina calcarata]XP_017893251.1 neutral ceramidase isoform X1 [Ceratina calcarata]XP_017893252.1 neutral ceramidase isoform X1 [Ceratina calcarata]XP_017893253.1 neutral ceramidase isoform X1 [Ceratina calcarata]XP_017893254.1 neutral ceramidase isoform X1 [Ceratina calcarata]XP_026666591.1 neutral ceramidase isoform X2 [Ceratina calcarata]
METPALGNLKTIVFLAIWVLQLLVPGAIASYSIGVGRADATGPTAEVVFMGYAKIDQKGLGIHLRTFSRAFIIDDGEERFVFVSVDSAMISNGVRKSVLQKLQEHFGSMYTEKNVMISGTHSHSTPGGFMMDVLFDLTTFGFVKQTFDAMVNGIVKSIERAHNAVGPGRIFITHGEVHGANINRSPLAYLNNPKAERDKYKYDVDKILTQMQFIDANGKPLGVINWFAVHPTSMNNTNHLVSSDNVGYASVLFERTVNPDALVGKGPFVAAFASTNLGDVSPNTRGPKCEFSGSNCSEQYTCPGIKEMCFASGPGKNMFESTSIIANRIFKESWRLWLYGEAKEVIGPLRVVHRYVNMVEQTAEFYNETSKEIEKVHGCEPAMGYSFAAGTTDGPGSFAFEQGTTTANPLWNVVRNLLAAPTAEDIKCHGAKPILLATGRMTLPYEWQPKIVATQVALIGNVVIAGVPGEFTTMSGRRLREAIKTVMNDASDSETSVIVAGLCNTYSDYVTTPEEYQIQRYEGASTIFGPHTLTIYLKQYQELVTAAILKKKVDPGPTPADLTENTLLSFVTPVLYDTPKWGRNFGDCIIQPRKIVEPGDIVTAEFISGHPRNNLMTESTFLTVERLANADDEVWVPIATDANWETKFEWKRTSVVLGSSQVTITWQVPEDIKPGEYRIRHNGYYRYILGGVFPYYGISNHFQVVANTSSRERYYE